LASVHELEIEIRVGLKLLFKKMFAVTIMSLLAICVFLPCTPAYAAAGDTFTDDSGLMFKVLTGSSRSVEVVANNYNGTNYAIPAYVRHDDAVYRVTAIGDEAFSECRALAGVDIPGGVRKIGLYAFRDCISLTSVTIPGSLRSIGEHAFNGCASLTSVTIPRGVTYIGEGAFYNCTFLAIYCEAWSKPRGWDDEWTSEYDNPAYWNINRSTLTQDELGIKYVRVSGRNEATVTKYAGRGASVAIPQAVTINGRKCAVTGIGNSAFAGCIYLSSVVIPKGVTSIGDKAFSGCESLRSAIIPDGVAEIGWGAFAGSKHLTLYFGEKSAPEGWEGGWNPDERPAYWGIGDANFTQDDSGMQYIKTSSENEATMTGYLGSSNAPTLPRTITIGEVICVVTDISATAFAGHPSLISVTIPDSLSAIGEGVFSGCPTLASVNIPDGLTAIGSSAFENCKSLASITIPKGVTSIGEKAFAGCSSLAGFVLPKDVKTISASLFSGCSALAGIAIPDGLTGIGGYAFENCGALRDVVIPKSVKVIGEKAFAGCSSLLNIAIPDGVRVISKGLFANCISLTEVSVPKNATDIGDSAFMNCTSMTDVDIPKSVKAIGVGAFEGCETLLAIDIPDGVTAVSERAFSACTSLKRFTVPKGVTSIGAYAFSGAAALREIVIPEGVTTIGDGAFSKCEYLRRISLPPGLKSIGGSVFSGCETLTSVLLPEGMTSIGAYSFFNCSYLASVFIPASVTTVGAEISFGCDQLTIYCEARDASAANIRKWDDRWNNWGSPVIWNVSGDRFAQDKNGIQYLTLQGNKATVLGYSGAAESLSIPRRVTINGARCDVTGIGAYAFLGCASLTNVTIPRSVTAIGMSVFKGCDALAIINCKAKHTPEFEYGWNAGVEVSWAGNNETVPVPEKYRISLFTPGAFWLMLALGGLLALLIAALSLSVIKRHMRKRY
jgi:hypothetical protein